MGERARYSQPHRPGPAVDGAGPGGMLPDKRALLDLLRQAFDQLPGAPCIRVEIPVPALGARAWLRAQDDPLKIYWRDRGGAFETAAIGAADVVADAETGAAPDFPATFSRLRRVLSCAHPDMRYYGGWAFDPAPAAEPWRAFGSCRFVLPRFELNIKGGTAGFACNVRRTAACGNEIADVGDQFDRLVFPRESRPASVPLFVAREDCPPRHEWERLVSAALDAIEARRFEKVVLARQVRLHYAAPPDVPALLDLLSPQAENAYLFCIQPAEGQAFIGVSPERLFKMLGGYVESEALAGTRPRGSSTASDVNLGHDLMHNSKELREHGFVADRLSAVLGGICRDMRMDKVLSLIRLRRCQHLVRRFEGILADGYTDAAVLRALHPTPAVGGHPDGPALEWLRANEPFSRGWYAGPVGWVGHDASEFAIAIRSGLVNGNTLTLYSGAGIVAGSVPALEWDETEAKLAAFLDVLSHND